jgi:hypothetical protein
VGAGRFEGVAGSHQAVADVDPGHSLRRLHMALLELAASPNDSTRVAARSLMQEVRARDCAYQVVDLLRAMSVRDLRRFHNEMRQLLLASDDAGEVKWAIALLSLAADPSDAVLFKTIGRSRGVHPIRGQAAT